MKKTLIIDGDNIFKAGYHAINYSHNGKHIGALFHVINTIRKQLDQNHYDKVILSWDGKDNLVSRRKVYPEYKKNRRKNDSVDPLSFDFQRTRVKQYIEETFVRQIELDGCESDDIIAYYCSISPDERKTIMSSDKDLMQLIGDNVEQYSPNAKRYYRKNDRVKMEKIEIPVHNMLTYKLLMGDTSDNIYGIKGVGEGTIKESFPELLEKAVSIADILKKAEELNNSKGSRKMMNVMEGVSKVESDDYYNERKLIMDLSMPMMTEEQKKMVRSVYEESVDPTGRDHKNLIRFMNEDGLFKFLPKINNDWAGFIQPFLKLKRKEKTSILLG